MKTRYFLLWRHLKKTQNTSMKGKNTSSLSVCSAQVLSVFAFTMRSVVQDEVSRDRALPEGRRATGSSDGGWCCCCEADRLHPKACAPRGPRHAEADITQVSWARRAGDHQAPCQLEPAWDDRCLGHAPQPRTPRQQLCKQRSKRVKQSVLCI